MYFSSVLVSFIIRNSLDMIDKRIVHSVRRPDPEFPEIRATWVNIISSKMAYIRNIIASVIKNSVPSANICNVCLWLIFQIFRFRNRCFCILITNWILLCIEYFRLHSDSDEKKVYS